MMIGDVTGLAKLVLDVAKLFFDAAQKEGASLKRAHLISLHERLVQVSATTKEYEVVLREPTLSASRDEIERRWVRSFASAVDALIDLDLAAVRVYAPELTDEIEGKLTVTEAVVAYEMAPRIKTPLQNKLLDIGERISKIPNA